MGKHSANRHAAGGRHVTPSRSVSLSTNRGLLAAGTAAGVAVVFGANLVSSAFGDNSAPVAPGTNLENIDVSVTSGHTVYARNASLSLVTTSDQQLVSVGSTVNFTYTLKNTGQTDFTNVRISDVGCSQIVGPTGNDSDPLLNIGETWTYTCSTVLLADQTNLATVTATPTLTTAAPRPSSSVSTPAPVASSSPSPTTSVVASPSSSPSSNTTVVNYVTLVNGIPVSVDPAMAPSVILAPGQSGGFMCASITNNTNGYQVWYDNGACFDGAAVLLWETPGATVVTATPTPTPVASPTPTVVPPTPTPVPSPTPTVAPPAPTPTPTPTVAPPTPTPTVAPPAPSPTPTVAPPAPSATPTVAPPAPTPTAPVKTVVDGVYTGTSTLVNVPGQGVTGNVQVVATITSGKISAITVPVCPSVDRTSKALCAAATPTLISEAIAANSANIASFSGATYTSAAFKTSLQSALTAAGY